MLRTFRFRLFFALLALSLIAVVPSQASSVIVTTFGTDYGSNTGAMSYLGVSGSTYSPGYSGIATPFTPSADFDVTTVDLLLGYAAFAGANNQVDVGIYTSSSGAPGTLIGELTPITVTAQIFNAPQVYSAPIGEVTGADGLVAGTQYWLVLLPTVNNTYVGWYNQQDGDHALSAQTMDGSTWDDSEDESQLYYDVMGTETGGNIQSEAPEPGAVALLGLGLGAIALLRRRRLANSVM